MRLNVRENKSRETACGKSEEADESANREQPAMKMKKMLAAAAAAGIAAISGAAGAETISMIIGAKTFDVEMNGTEAAANFMKRLPISQPFENFGKLERITYLKPALDTGKDALTASPKRGDLAYYIPWGNLCVFLIGGNAPSEDLVILGHMSEEALTALEKSGKNRVELRVKE